MAARLAGLKSRTFVLNNVHEDAPDLFHTRWVLSYLRGPLTRKQVRALSRGDAQGMAQPATSSHTRVSHASDQTGVGLRAGVAGAVGAAGADAGAASVSEARPILPDGIPERFLGGSPGCRYRAGLMGTVTCHFRHARTQTDEWHDISVIVPELGESIAGLFDAAEVHDLSRLPIRDEPAEGAAFGELPAGTTTKQKWRSVGKAIKTHIYATQALRRYRCAELKLWSSPGEDHAAFVGRVALMHREERDVAMEKLRKKYEPKLRRLEARIQKAEQKVEREKGQVRQRQLDTAVNVGTTVLGALFGRKSVARAGASARSAGRISQEKQQVKDAEENLVSLQEDLEALELEFEASVTDAKLELAEAPEVTETLVRPLKSDLDVRELAVLWIQE